MTLLNLVVHPASVRGAVESLRARVARREDGALDLLFVLRAPMERIVVPEPSEPRRADGLWRHTCFECFVGGGGDRYSEFNFAPSGEWAAYAFSGYRNAEPQPPAFDPHIAVKRAAAMLELQAVVPAAALPERAGPLSWKIGLSAVVEQTSGDVAYWALRHAPGKPDFHHPQAFAHLL